MAKRISKKINSKFNPTFVGGHPVYAYGGRMKYGLGSFLKDKVFPVVGDAGKLMADNALSAFGATDVIGDDAYQTRIGKGISSVTNPINQTLGGIGLSIAGLGSVQGLGQAANTAVNNNTQEMALQQQQEMLKKQAIDNLPAQHNYQPTFADGGNMGDTKTVKNKNYINSWDNYHNLQGRYTEALANKYPDIPIRGILNSYASDSTFTNRNVDQYANDLISQYGDFHLNPAEMDSMSNAVGADIRDLDRTLTGYDKGTFNDSINTVGTKEDANTRFGPRMMLQKRYKSGESPYKYLETKAGGGTIGDLDNTSYISNGGTHEQSKLGGVPMGKNALVEEGEYIWEGPSGKYVFSNRF